MGHWRGISAQHVPTLSNTTQHLSLAVLLSTFRIFLPIGGRYSRFEMDAIAESLNPLGKPINCIVPPPFVEVDRTYWHPVLKSKSASLMSAVASGYEVEIKPRWFRRIRKYFSLQSLEGALSLYIFEDIPKEMPYLCSLAPNSKTTTAPGVINNSPSRQCTAIAHDITLLAGRKANTSLPMRPA